MKITEDVRKCAAEQAVSEEEALKEGMEEVEGFEPSGGEREDFCAAKGGGPKVREQLSQFVEKARRFTRRREQTKMNPQPK